MLKHFALIVMSTILVTSMCPVGYSAGWIDELMRWIHHHDYQRVDEARREKYINETEKIIQQMDKQDVPLIRERFEELLAAPFEERMRNITTVDLIGVVYAKAVYQHCDEHEILYLYNELCGELRSMYKSSLDDSKNLNSYEEEVVLWHVTLLSRFSGTIFDRCYQDEKYDLVKEMTFELIEVPTPSLRVLATRHLKKLICHYRYDIKERATFTDRLHQLHHEENAKIDSDRVDDIVESWIRSSRTVANIKEILACL